MNWTDKFAEGSFSLYAGQSLSGFQPLDFFNYFPLFYDLWMVEVASVIKKLDLENKSYKEIQDILPVVSSIRAILMKIIPTYKSASHEKEAYKIVTEFLNRMVHEAAPDDPYSLNSNPVHSENQLNVLLESVEWKEADPKIGRKIGQLITAAGSMVHGLYNDVVTDLGWDAYGPYDIEYEGKHRTLLIRDFVDMTPLGLGWDTDLLLSGKEIKIYSLFEDVVWQICSIGCHAFPREGSPVTGMRNYAVTLDGKYLSLEEIDVLIEELSSKAEAIYKEIRTKDFEELKSMVLLQELYQFHKLFDEAGVDWRPTKKMLDRTMNKELVPIDIPAEEFMETVDQYKEVFGIDYFNREVLGN